MASWNNIDGSQLHFAKWFKNNLKSYLTYWMITWCDILSNVNFRNKYQTNDYKSLEESRRVGYRKTGQTFGMMCISYSDFYGSPKSAHIYKDSQNGVLNSTNYKFIN